MPPRNLLSALGAFFAFGAAPADAQSAASPAPQAESEKIVTLSPFEVTADNKGYYASNTMSGTRLNSNIEDLGASITVVTKEQMADFALLDINDIFGYEAGTEGIGNFTEISFDSNGQPIDGTQLSPQTANRIRGVGPANTTFGNFETSGRVPIDPINIESVEISRGPNASIFGIGSPAGSVNSVPASANLSRHRSQITARADSNDGYRTTLDLNRVLKPNVLAVRGSAVFQHDGFHLKPSGTDTHRLNGMVKYRPFKSTTLSAAYSYYKMHGNRPNAGMPRDGITGWLEAGAPTWDPITASGQLNGARFTANTARYFQTVGRTFSQIYVDRDGISYWSAGRTSSTGSPAGANQTIEVRGAVPDVTGFLVAQPLFQDYPVATSRSLYDWQSINLAAANTISDKTETASASIEHIAFNTPRHSLALQLSWFREAAERFERNSVGQPPGNPNSVTVLQADINERRLDGTPNPFFLRPFIGVTAPSYFDRPLDNDTYRAQLAYALDLRNERGLLRRLGRHQLSGYVEYKDYRARTVEYKDAIVDQHAWLPPGASRANLNSGGGLTAANQVSTGFFRYYLGDNAGYNVDYPSAAFDRGPYAMTWGNGVTGEFFHEPVELGSAVTTAGKSRTVLRSRGLILQSHFLRDRIVTTLGRRHDARSSMRRSNFRFLPDGVGLDYADLDRWNNEGWTASKGDTNTAGVVVKPLRWLSVFANRSDSFQPQPVAFGLRQQPLPDPQGKGKDHGVALNLFDGRLVVRANRYKTTQINARNGVSSNLVARVTRIDYANSGTTSAFRLQVKANEWVAAAAAARGETLTADVAAQRVAAIMQLPVDYLNFSTTDFPVGATEDTLAEGTEIEINYNPTNHWTAKLNVTKQDARFANLSPDITAWLADRLPVWQGIIDPVIGRPWFTERYNNAQSASENYLNQVEAPLGVAQAMEGKSKSQIRKYRANLSTNFRLSGVTDHRILKRFNVGGALRWEDQAVIGYRGLQEPPAIVTALDPSRPIHDRSHLYVDFLAGYRTSLFADRVQARFQLNVRNLTEDGRLQPAAADPDGRPTALRIIEPRLFIFSVTLDL